MVVGVAVTSLVYDYLQLHCSRKLSFHFGKLAIGTSMQASHGAFEDGGAIKQTDANGEYNQWHGKQEATNESKNSDYHK